MKLRINKGIIFITISIIFLLGSCLFYGYRLIHFYRIENPKGEKIVKNLNEILKNNVVYEGEGLYQENDEYYFYGKSVNNYIFYSGKMYRIISIDSKGLVKIISDEPQTVLYYGNNGYNDSYIKEYLEEYYNTLNKEYLIDTVSCVDTIDKDISCKKKKKSKISLLSLEEYKKAGDKNSFLNSNYYEWLLNTDSGYNPWYINEDGTVSILSNKASLGVTPVITLKNDIEIIVGDGSFDNPYIIENITQDNINTMNIGSYVKYSGYTWRILSNDDNVKLILVDDLISMNYSDYDNVFEPTIYNSVAYYLNNDFYNSLVNNSNIIDSVYYNGLYEDDFKNIKNSQVIAKVGLPSVGDMLIKSNTPYFTITPTGEATQAIYVVEGNGRYAVSDIYESYMVKPVINILGTSKIVGGIGTINNPLILE